MPCSGPKAKAWRQVERLGQLVNCMRWDGDWIRVPAVEMISGGNLDIFLR